MTETGLRRRMRLIMALILLVALTVVLITALPVSASHVSDGGVDEPWIEAMNQETYWETRFGGQGLLVDCTKFSDHSGYIPASYEAAVIKDGNMVRVYNPAPDDAVALGAVNPANGKHFDPPHSWVMKCDITVVTTTTEPEEEDTTTTSTTVQDTTTTTIADTTTTTEATTTTSEATTTTTIADTTTTTQPDGSTLPFTGADTGLMVGLGAAVMALGALLLFAIKERGANDS